MVFKIAIATLFVVSSAKRLPVYDSQNILLASQGGDWMDDEKQQDFDGDTVDEVHDYTPETELIQTTDEITHAGLDGYAEMTFEAGTADEVSRNPVIDELEDFDDSLI